ncbi:MAG: polyprenol monophosphomannose synthase [Actinomycetes bacterium]
MPTAVWLILPTYNEAENLPAILDACASHLESAVPNDWRILVVDDSSPDGTGRIADEAAERDHRIEVCHRRKKEGLGRAYVEGFRIALAGGAERVLQMDSDFSHDPADLPRLVAAAQGADVVLGSRYTSGGAIRDWGLVRRILSRGGCWYARLVLGVEVSDLTGGFKCLNRRTLELIDLDSVKAQGYVFQIEMTYRAVLEGLKVVEVPIVFRDRKAGSSKMSGRIALEAMVSVIRLRRRAEAESSSARTPRHD